MEEVELRAKPWRGAWRELKRLYRRDDPIARKVIHWLSYTWLPRCHANAQERVRLETSLREGQISKEEYDRRRTEFEDKFHRKELMEDIGLDFVNRNHYHAVSVFFRRERELTTQVLRRFSQELRWQNLRESGRTIEEIWWEFVQSCLSWGVFPVYADPDDGNHHKLLLFADFRWLFEHFRKRVNTELSRKTAMVTGVEAGGRGLPLRAGLDPLPLPKNPFLSLPEPRVCPDCQVPFSTDRELVDHHRSTHS